MIGLAAAVAAYNRAAAELVIARRLLHQEMDADAQQKRERRDRAVCGTSSGYRRHRREKTLPCPACTEANSRDKKQNQMVRRVAS